MVVNLTKLDLASVSVLDVMPDSLFLCSIVLQSMNAMIQSVAPKRRIFSRMIPRHRLSLYIASRNRNNFLWAAE